MLKLLNFLRPQAQPLRRPNRAKAAPHGLAVTDADWVKRRDPQRQQDLVLSDQVLVWLQGLPQPVRPSQTCAGFPRVANRIALCWDDVALTEQVFEALLISRRGKRQGFPPAVAAELMRLRQFHGRRRLDAGPLDVWDMNDMATIDR